MALNSCELYTDSDSFDDAELTMNDEVRKLEGTSHTMEELLDLHVLIVPRESWLDEHRTANNTAIYESTSAGFIRTQPFTSLLVMRNVIASQRGVGIVPECFIFLRAVGRCLVVVHRNQEAELTAADFVRYPAFEILLLPCGANRCLMKEKVE